MQLVEPGKLDLDTDVDQYLADFQIPDTFPISGGIRHRWENRNEPAPGRWTARLAAALGLLTLLFFGIAFAIVSALVEELFYGIAKSMTAALSLPRVTAVLLERSRWPSWSSGSEVSFRSVAGSTTPASSSLPLGSTGATGTETSSGSATEIPVENPIAWSSRVGVHQGRPPDAERRT